MALIQITFNSVLLKRLVNFHVCLPDDRRPEALKTVFLLHDYGESCWSWLTGADLQGLADRFGAALLLPNDENHFYVNAVRRGDSFTDHIGRELPGFCRRVFPFSTQAEDTVIAGLRVGGYGALRIGLEFPETFGHVLAADPALVLDTLSEKTEEPDCYGLTARDYQSIFGDPARAAGGENDPLRCAAALRAWQRPLPALTVGCGPYCAARSGVDAFCRGLPAMSIPFTRVDRGNGTRQALLDLLGITLAQRGW